MPLPTRLIAEDNEGGLFTVTLFRKVIEDFKVKAKENKFIVREFYYDEKEIKREREEMTRLLSDKKQQYVSTGVWEGLFRLLRCTPQCSTAQSPFLSLTVPIS